MLIHIETELTGNELVRLFHFAEQICNGFSFSRNFYGVLPEEEIALINQKYMSVIMEENKMRREKFKKDPDYHQRILEFINSEEDAVKYFDDVYEQDMECAKILSLDGNDEPYQTHRSDFIKKEFTRNTVVTRGPLFEVCYFAMQETWEEAKQQFQNLYTRPVIMDEIEFEDPTFYKDGRVKIAVCSHEHFCFMELTEEELQKFDQLGIQYEKSIKE